MSHLYFTHFQKHASQFKTFITWYHYNTTSVHRGRQNQQRIVLVAALIPLLFPRHVAHISLSWTPFEGCAHEDCTVQVKKKIPKWLNPHAQVLQIPLRLIVVKRQIWVVVTLNPSWLRYVDQLFTNTHLQHDKSLFRINDEALSCLTLLL